MQLTVLALVYSAMAKAAAVYKQPVNLPGTNLFAILAEAGKVKRRSKGVEAIADWSATHSYTQKDTLRCIDIVDLLSLSDRLSLKYQVLFQKLVAGESPGAKC